ncbi:MAG: carnitine-CoA ligase [Solirubrobacterales bacterium]|jgi:crotonobetaine/carnitine-CoA ligase|nr:carnitine-CoA ligase [Solirubrobacterales bacterium]
MSMAATVATELQPAGETIRSFWDGRVAATPSAPFLVYGQGTESYEEFDAVVNSSANGLAAQGVQAGDRVALLLPSDRQLLVLELALAKLGAVMVPMISNLSRPEIVYVLDHCEASVFITDAAGWEVSAADGDLGLDHELTAYVLGGAEGARDADVLVADEISPPPQPGIGPMDPMAIMYTSGSTGKPKGVIQPGAGFATAGRALAARQAADASDNFFCAIPIFHTAGAHMLLAPAIAVGARFTLIPKFSRSQFWDQVRESGATLSIVMPAQLSILMTAPASERDREHELRCVASHVRPADFCERFGVDVVTCWAMTEVSGMGTMSALGSSRHPEKYIGRPVPEEAEAKIVKPDGEPAAPMEPGELWFRHPHVMRAYHRNPTATAESLVDGWVRTGDLCAADEQGGIYFHGRIKHVIKRAGENISGEEVEAAVVAHPEVEECIVVGVPDPIYTEEIYATVSLRPGAQLDETELIEWCGQQLATWKLPRYLDFGDAELPKLANGKPDRRRIADAAAIDAAWDRVAAESGAAR